MKFPGAHNLSLYGSPALVAALLITSSAVFLPGCRNSTTAAATPSRVVGKPPAVHVFAASGDAGHADPLLSPLWQSTQNGAWLSLTAPINMTRMPTPSQAKILYDDDALYIAFINEQEISSTSALGAKDEIAVYLDTTDAGKGTEMLAVSVGSTGGPAACTWVRAATPAEPRDDGSADLGHPVSLIPNIAVSRLTAQVREDTRDGRAVWTAVLTIPLSSLPLPLRTEINPDAHWKFNLIRTVRTGGGILQSNLSPVQINAQAVSPYRMADLYLEPRD